MKNLDYIEWLLERLVWLMSPTNKDHIDFRNDILKEQFDASRKSIPTALHGDVRAQPAARQGEMPEHDQEAVSRFRFDASEGTASPFRLEKEDDRKWPELTPMPPSDKAEDLPAPKPVSKRAELQILPQWLRR